MTILPRLLVLTDRRQVPDGSDLVSVLARCADAGLTHVVFRELDLGADARAARVAELAALGLHVVSARGAVAGAWGVHLASGQDASVAAGLPFGRSCHSRGDVRSAVRGGASWVTLSPFARTASKPGHGPPLAPQSYRGHDIAVYALGGITPQNAGAALAAGSHGVAVMGAVMRAADPGAVVSDLLGVIRAQPVR